MSGEIRRADKHIGALSPNEPGPSVVRTPKQIINCPEPEVRSPNEPRPRTVDWGSGRFIMLAGVGFPERTQPPVASGSVKLEGRGEGRSHDRVETGRGGKGCRMEVSCPHCGRVLEFSGDRPRFCGY